MRYSAKPFAIEVKRSRKLAEAVQAGGWVGQMLARAERVTTVTKPVPQANQVPFKPIAEPTDPRRILPDLSHQPLNSAEKMQTDAARERRMLSSSAKREARAAVRQAIADLNALGFDYCLVRKEQR